MVLIGVGTECVPMYSYKMKFRVFFVVIVVAHINCRIISNVRICTCLIWRENLLIDSTIHNDLLTLRIMYFNGTVGNICLIDDAKSVIITSAFYWKKGIHQNAQIIIIRLINESKTSAENGLNIFRKEKRLEMKYSPNWNCQHRRLWQMNRFDH